MSARSTSDFDGLGVHALGHRRVAGQVGEQHGDLAALLRQRARAAATGAGTGAPSSAVPQLMQKRAAPGAGVPQDGQARSSCVAAGHAEAGVGRILGSAARRRPVRSCPGYSCARPADCPGYRGPRRPRDRPAPARRAAPSSTSVSRGPSTLDHRPGQGGYQKARSLRSRSSPGRTTRSSSSSARDT